ncbi:hypothetical protein JM946_04810 [Steroidobacter sp. S1-65]|uniref:Anti-sigma factor n=1 Tax=Steroidobacter gossypii TaxID=2805490 RepID=A0ABS1WSU7_9GAMM|nr:hypothetical protein [Steroidobacter gossypii]MBM0104050.1 hypothetical protein [Steroidobacter gossypii]
MDRKYIESEHIVDRYLSGDLTVREARDFEKFCLDNPAYLQALPIPVRLKTRLARRPVEGSETGVFEAIPSSTTRAALEVVEDEDFDPDEPDEEPRWKNLGAGLNRVVVLTLLVGLAGAIAAAVVFKLQASSLAEQLQDTAQEMTATQLQPPGSVQRYKLQMVKAKPSQPTFALGWLTPPQLLDISIDASEGRITQYQITIDKSDGVRVMQIKRIMRDSNKEVRFTLNSSAFGPGNYLVKVDGYNWRGQTQEVGWMMLGLE